MKNIIVKVPHDIEHYFNSKVWGRAYEVYHNHQIVSVYAKNENEIVAQVQGTALYTVFIRLMNDHITMECNCPYWDYCKHEAAVVMYLKDHPEIELKDEEISMELSKLDEFKLFISSVQYELDSDETYRHDNEAYDNGVNDCVDFIENSLASRKEKLEMLILLMKNFVINRAVSSCLMRLYLEDFELCENVLYSYLEQEECLFYELCHIGDYQNNKNEKENYRMLINNMIQKLDSNQINMLKEYMVRHERAWDTVKNLFNA